MGAGRALSELAASFRGADVLVLCYHRVRSRERFRAHMTVLADQGCSVLASDQFTEWLGGQTPIQRPAVVLTFDGCYPDQLDNAVPVLQAFKFPAIFFPVSGSLVNGSTNHSVRRRNELLDLVNLGHTIGCHSHTHPDLTTLSPAESHREVVGSKRILEDSLGQQVNVFCYPHGACNALVTSVVREAGFEVAFTVDLGGVRLGDDPFRLKRVPVLGEPNTQEFAAYLSGRFGVSGALLLAWKVRERWFDLLWRGPEVE